MLIVPASLMNKGLEKTINNEQLTMNKWKDEELDEISKILFTIVKNTRNNC